MKYGYFRILSTSQYIDLQKFGQLKILLWEISIRWLIFINFPKICKSRL
jgi:hypothetical protein